MANHPIPLETVAVSVSEDALEAFEAALANACDTVGFFRNHDTGVWRVEGVKQVGVNEAELASSLAVAAIMTGASPVLERSATEADGWLARTYASFPEQLIGRYFAVRGTHLTGPEIPNRITLTLDAGLAFGTGEHGSTRGCLVALETVARRRPAHILDMGTGSGILAMAAARLLNRPVLATDIEPWAVRVAAENAELNGVAHLVRVRLADGWSDPFVRSQGPYDLVFGNILARPLCLMARDLALNLAPGGTAILAGLLANQARWVLSAHRAQGLRLERMVPQGPWTTIVVRK
ncbi:MAG: ribosomal protein methyltransferase [Acetobacteraceae bacterium]|jgi:ribosomal protein L11 methyltransferase|nr:ribosomal protein methyltransferase [Acetobacteraceae bacterium]